MSQVLAPGIGVSWPGAPAGFLPLEAFAARHGALVYWCWPGELPGEFERNWVRSRDVFREGFPVVLHRAVRSGYGIVFNLAGVTRASTMTYWEVTRFQLEANASWLDHTTFYDDERLLSRERAQQRRQEILAT